MIKRDKNSGDLLEIFGIDKEEHNDVVPNRNDNEIDDIDKGGYKGLVTCNEYIFWCNVNIVFDHVFHFLKDTFPQYLITSEFNNIDIFVFGERLPVEIQSTIYHYSEQIPRMSGFEQAVEKQIRAIKEISKNCIEKISTL